MNKSDLIKALAAKEDLPIRQATEVINLIFAGFRDSLQNGGRIEIRGFGSFSVREYGAYTGRNLRTGEEFEVAAKKLPHFRAGKEMKGLVDAGRACAGNNERSV